jgi:hypothetical protein
MAQEEKNPMAEEVRENFTLKTLQERVWRLESENKELRVNNSILQTQYTSQCETQSDILRTLHANLDENYNKIEESEARIMRLEQMLEDQQQEFKDKLEEERAQWERNMSELRAQKDHLEEKLAEVAEFQRNKETMEGDLANLKKQLADQAEEHARAVSAFDRKKAIEIDQLKKDMQRTVKETREMLKARTKDQLDSTTKRTIMENEQMATELHFQSRETERLLDRNQSLLEENSQLRRNLLIHKDLENELARRTHVYQKLIKKMDQKQKMEAASREQSRELRVGSTQDDAGLEASMSEMVSGEELEKAKRESEGLQNTLQMVRHEFAQYRRDHATLTQLQDQSTRLIISALYEMKNQRESGPFPPESYDEGADWQFVNMTPKQKEYFFRVLLEKLNSSMCHNCFPTGDLSAGMSTLSSTSLPNIQGGHAHNHGAGGGKHFSQFLWSVATVGENQMSVDGAREVSTQGTQTETADNDPCLKQGFWSPESRAKFSDKPILTPDMVKGGVRPWGSSSLTRRPRMTHAR